MPQKPFKGFRRKQESMTQEQKIEGFVLRNSDNGYFTRVSTISSKFNISDETTWQIIGQLLSDGNIESVHDDSTGEMKLCRLDNRYKILYATQKRRKSPGGRPAHPHKSKKQR